MDLREVAAFATMVKIVNDSWNVLRPRRRGPNPAVQSLWLQSDCWFDSCSKKVAEVVIRLAWDVRVHVVVVVVGVVKLTRPRKTHPKPSKHCLYFFVSFRGYLYPKPSAAYSFVVVGINFATADLLLRQPLLDSVCVENVNGVIVVVSAFGVCDDFVLVDLAELLVVVRDIQSLVDPVLALLETLA